MLTSPKQKINNTLLLSPSPSLSPLPLSSPSLTHPCALHAPDARTHAHHATRTRTHADIPWKNQQRIELDRVCGRERGRPNESKGVSMLRTPRIPWGSAGTVELWNQKSIKIEEKKREGKRRERRGEKRKYLNQEEWGKTGCQDSPWQALPKSSGHTSTLVKARLSLFSFSSLYSLCHHSLSFSSLSVLLPSLPPISPSSSLSLPPSLSSSEIWYFQLRGQRMVVAQQVKTGTSKIGNSIKFLWWVISKHGAQHVLEHIGIVVQYVLHSYHVCPYLLTKN